MANNIYIGDIGTLILIDMGEDVSEAVSPVFRVKKPDGTEVEWTAEVGDTDNILQYTIVEGDLDQAGTYAVNPYLTLGDWTGSGDTVKFKVLDRYKTT